MAIHKATQRHSYTILDNRILRGTELSAMAKMVLAICLSLPDDWRFNIQGLCSFCREGPDAVASAIQELEKAGYIERRRIRNKGKITGIEYEIYEVPRVPHTEKPDVGAPDLEKPDKAVPEQVPEVLPIIDQPNKNVPNIYAINTLSTNQEGQTEDRIRQQIEYDVMCQRYDPRLMDDLVAVMASAFANKGDKIAVGKETVYPTSYVQACMDRINPLHIEQIMESMLRNRPIVRNMRAYLLSALINTANTMDMGYQFGEE